MTSCVDVWDWHAGDCWLGAVVTDLGGKGRQAQRACTRSARPSSANAALGGEASCGRISATRTAVALKHLTPTAVCWWRAMTSRQLWRCSSPAATKPMTRPVTTAPAADVCCGLDWIRVGRGSGRSGRPAGWVGSGRGSKVFFPHFLCSYF